MRNTTMSVCKGIAIILMVVGHAEAPELITNFIYTFHMPIFFIAAGYFFTAKYLSEPWTFVARRFKGLYVPFLKWSLLFLLLHNVFFHYGILNEQFGNWTGGVTHPYTFDVAMRRIWRMITSMSGYDEFMAGAFWFFRGLLVASILYMVLARLLQNATHRGLGACAAVICLLMAAVVYFRLKFDVNYFPLPNGGWREIWGVFFFGIGVIFSQYHSRIKYQGLISVACLAFLCYAATQHFCGMNNGANYADIITLPLTGTAGFFMIHTLSGIINRRESWLKRMLVYIGDNTLYVFVFHIIAFKSVSLLKIWWYDLPFEQIGCHMVIHDMRPDLFWIPYSIAGVALPLLWLYCYRAVPRPWTAVRRLIMNYK